MLSIKRGKAMSMNKVCSSDKCRNSLLWIGKVKFFDPIKNFGYITNLLLDEEYYFTLGYSVPEDGEDVADATKPQIRIRLIQIAKEFKVGLNTITDYLRNSGVTIDGSPNTLINANAYRLLERKFGANRADDSTKGHIFNREIRTGRLVLFRVAQVVHNRVYKDNAIDVQLIPQGWANIEQVLTILRESVPLAILKKFKKINPNRQLRILGIFLRYQIQAMSNTVAYNTVELLLKYYKLHCSSEEWKYILNDLPYNEYTYKLWLNKVIDTLFRSSEDLYNYIFLQDNSKTIIEELIHNGKLDFSNIVEIYLRYFEKFGINSEQELIWAYKKMQGIESPRLPISIRLLKWTRSEDMDGFDEQFLSFVYLLPSQEQHLFFRKLIESHRLGLYRLSTGKLLQIVNADKNLDVSLQIVIKSLCKYKQCQQLLTDKELFDVFIGKERKRKDQITNMFAQISNCTLFNRCEKVYYDRSVSYLKSGYRLRLLPPTSTEYDIKLETGECYEKRRDYAPEVPFCEGKLSDRPHRITNAPYHWCLGQSIHECQGIARNEDYKQYTLYDFAAILSLNIDLKQLSAFYAQLNWFCLHYEHLSCRQCGYTIEPTEQNHFNAHRLTYFHCNNPQCEEYHKSIYLNHCFQSECNHIIDSRDSARCPNGFVICRKCGSCCAGIQFTGKDLAGIELGNHATKLRTESKFHLDRGEFYCPDCGELLIDDTIEYRGEVIKVKKCPNHQDYIGVFPRMRHKTENNKIKNLLKTKN